MSHTQRPRRSKRKTDLEEASTSSNGEEALTQPAPGTEVLVANIVQHLLTMSSNKMPIKRPNIIKHFLHGENKNFDDVFKMACNMMLDVSIFIFYHWLMFYRWFLHFRYMDCTLYKLILN